MYRYKAHRYPLHPPPPPANARRVCGSLTRAGEYRILLGQSPVVRVCTTAAFTITNRMHRSAAASMPCIAPSLAELCVPLQVTSPSNPPLVLPCMPEPGSSRAFDGPALPCPSYGRSPVCLEAWMCLLAVPAPIFRHSLRFWIVFG